MTWLEYVKAILMVPKARIHLIKIMQMLQHHSYDKLITDSSKSGKKNNSIEVTVKSYFWACRTIKNCHCLPRSIALYQKLRASGYQVEHKFGVNNQDQAMTAHAWVEYQKRPLNESEDLKQRFKVMDHPD